MAKYSDTVTARESVWVHRLRQRIAFERIVLQVGKPEEQAKAKKFLAAMEEAHPDLLEDIEQYMFDFFTEHYEQPPELFDESEYTTAKGRKTALKLPKDIRWEERNIRRAAREFHELFHPCETLFNDAMKGLQYLNHLLPELFIRARSQAIAQREKILSAELYCPCQCATPADSQPADSFENTDHGRFASVTRRIACARQALLDGDDTRRGHWQFFLDRIREIAPEMLQG